MLAILGIFGKKEKFYAQVEDESPSSTVAATNLGSQTVSPATVSETPAPKATKTSKKTSKKTGTTAAPTVAKSFVAPEPFWVKAMENTRNYPQAKQPGTEMTFSTDYLLPKPTNFRRRPGPSLNPFLGMARQIGRRGSI